MSSAAPANSNGNFAERPRLTEQEKKNNHIASEQKRRQAIREGFDRLAEIVPGMKGQGRSEAQMLTATVDEMRKQLDEKARLRTIAMTRLGLSDLEFEEMYRQERAKINNKYDGR